MRILFVCIENACRSQMAEGFARHYGGKNIEVSSGRSKPGSRINENALKVMNERGINIGSQEPSEINSEEIRNSDLVVTMGCGPDGCPVPLGGETIEWDIEDPSGKAIGEFRKVRNRIEMKVRNLMEGITEKS